MDRILENHLTNKEKTLIALSAAMGAGCRTCADKLHTVAVSLGISGEEMLEACQWGLDAKAEAVHTMRKKVSEIIVNGGKANRPDGEGPSQKLRLLARAAAFAAANSAPDFSAEMEKGQGLDLRSDQVQTCISLARMVRKNAGVFSDQEVSDQVSGIPSDGEEVCCPVTPGQKGASACSCS